MCDYSKAIIYTIRTNNNIYVGSTINFRTRKNHHKSSLYNEKSKNYNSKLYKTIRENDGNWDMKPYKEFPCENKTQLVIEEEKIRKEMNADLNSITCGTGLDEKTYKKEYNIKNKERLAEQKQKHYHDNKEKYTDYQKEYKIKNKEKIAERKKQHYQENRQKVLEQHKEKITCECGCIVGKYFLSKHKKSKKHQDLIKFI